MKLLWFNLRVDRDRISLAFAVDWLNTVAEQVERIDVITMWEGDYQVRENVHVYSVGKEKGYSEPRRVFEFYRLLFKLLKTRSYDGCFAHMMPLFVAMAAPILRIKQIPIVLWYTHKSVTIILRLATLLVDRVVTASKESFRIQSDKVRVIGHGIEIERFIPSEKDRSFNRPFTILSVSRLSPIKRIDLLIESVALLKKNHPECDVCLKIIGGPLTKKDRGYVDKLRQQIQQFQIEDSVVFEGKVPFRDIVLYYQQTDCFVNMSETGAIDKTVLEAMSCETPVIANPVFSDILGKELAQAWVVNWDVEQLTDRLLMMSTMSALERQELGRQLRAIVVRDHSLQTLCQSVLGELKDLNCNQAGY